MLLQIRRETSSHPCSSHLSETVSDGSGATGVSQNPSCCRHHPGICPWHVHTQTLSGGTQFCNLAFIFKGLVTSIKPFSNFHSVCSVHAPSQSHYHPEGRAWLAREEEISPLSIRRHRHPVFLSPRACQASTKTAQDRGPIVRTLEKS